MLHLCFRDTGGAGRACQRMHQALREAGTDSLALFGLMKEAPGHAQEGSHPAHRLWQRWAPAVQRRALSLRFGQAAFQLRSGSVPGLLRNDVRRLKPDVLHVHGIHEGFLSAGQLAAWGLPVVFTLHDMLPFSPGYHYRGDVAADQAGSDTLLPEALPAPMIRLGQRILSYKRHKLGAVRGAVTAPSCWLLNEAGRSGLFPTMAQAQLPYAFPVPPQVLDKASARGQLGLAPEVRYLLFGAEAPGEKRKGLQHLEKAVDEIAARKPPDLRVEVLVFGTTDDSITRRFALPCRNFGVVRDPRLLRAAYASADVFACPSREDNTPNTVIEALAEGTPAVAFNTGGLPDLIVPGQDGALVECFDEKAYGRALLGVLEGTGNWDREAIRARASVKFSPEDNARKLQTLYSQVA